MTPEEQNLGTRSHREWLEKGDADVVDEIYAEDCVIYNRHVPDHWKRGRDGFKAYGTALYNAFPDIRIVHDSVVTAGNTQFIRWTFNGTHTGPFFGIPPTGRAVSIQGMDIFVVEKGQIAALWLEQDLFALMDQLGVIPHGPPAGAAA